MEFLTDCNVAQPGAVQLHAGEEDKSSRALGVVKNKSMTAGSRAGCLQPSLCIGYASFKLCFQSTHTN